MIENFLILHCLLNVIVSVFNCQFANTLMKGPPSSPVKKDVKVAASPVKKDVSFSPTKDVVSFDSLSDRNLLSLKQFELRAQLGAQVVAMAKKKQNEQEFEEKLWLKGFHAVIGHIMQKAAAGQDLMELLKRNVVDADAFYVQLIKCVENKQHIAVYLTRRGDLARYLFNAGLNDESFHSARRKYLKALSFDPLLGLAHNQLGVLALQQDEALECLYRFLMASCVGSPFGLAKKNLEDAVAKFGLSCLFEGEVQCARRALLLAHFNESSTSVVNHLNLVLEQEMPCLPAILIAMSYVQHNKCSGLVNLEALAEYLNDLKEPEEAEGELCAIGTPVPELSDAHHVLGYVDEAVTSARVRQLDTLRIRRLVWLAQSLDDGDLKFDSETGLFNVQTKRIKLSESMTTPSFKPFQSSNKS